MGSADTGRHTVQYRAFKITFSTTKVKLFTTVIHIKQRTKLASIKIHSYKRLSHVSDSFVLGRQKYFMLNHTQGCLLHAALVIQTIIDNLQNVESIA